MAKGAYKAYRKALADVYGGWWCAWPLTQKVHVGDVRALHDGGSVPAGTLAGRGIEAKSGPTGAPGDIAYDAEGTVDVRFKAAGAAAQGFASLAAADAGALVEFRAGHSALVVYTGMRQNGVEDVAQLAQELIRRCWLGEWDSALFAVTEVISARAGTVLTAEKSGASAELKIQGEAGPGPLNLVDLAGRVAFHTASSVGLRWTGTDLTPCYRGVRIRTSWWRDEVVAEYGTTQPGRGLSADPVPELLLEQARDQVWSVVERVGPDDDRPLGGD
ncbi:hypothetical protein AB0B50_10025 [Streptomyces sp. NPDC041068]|uniref:hypothetical protein n=1 Tax=Streptomyces sp. NPDC041068 TaxID=3155130 RepID=UPI0033E5B291